MKVLIIKTSALGDIIHALAVIDYLRQVSPGIEIDWVAEEQFLPLLEHNPGVRRVIPVRTKKWRKAPFSKETRRDIKALRVALRERSYDLVFDIQGNLKSGLIARLSGCAERTGFAVAALQEKVNALFTNRRIPFRECDRTVSERYLRVVSAPFNRDYRGMELAAALCSSSDDEAAADRYRSELPEGLLVLFQVGTTWNTKLWYPEGWIELARRIVAQRPGTTILVNWGSPDEKALGEQIAREVGAEVRLLPWLRIRELIPVLGRMNLVIGGDTGPLYLAAAAGVPTVSFYRATSAAAYAPRGERHRTIQAPLECAGCSRTSCGRDDECRRSITVDALFAAVTELI